MQTNDGEPDENLAQYQINLDWFENFSSSFKIQDTFHHTVVSYEEQYV